MIICHFFIFCFFFFQAEDGIRDKLVTGVQTCALPICSKEKIATNVLTNRLKHLQTEGFIKKLDPSGTKKSTRYIATDKGISSLPIIIELYLFSIQILDESILDESQMKIKEEICHDRASFEVKRKEDYLHFITDLKQSLELSNLLVEAS